MRVPMQDSEIFSFVVGPGLWSFSRGRGCAFSLRSGAVIAWCTIDGLCPQSSEFVSKFEPPHFGQKLRSAVLRGVEARAPDITGAGGFAQARGALFVSTKAQTRKTTPESFT
jgi:hypothetical protein